MSRHLLTGAELSREELDALLDRGQQLADAPLSSRALEGRSVALIFQKPSTRTRVSFEVGIDELGGHAVVLRSDELQLSRGEALRDTALVLSRHVAAIGLRTGPDEALEELARYSAVPVINMLSARHHPCQALADLLTLSQSYGRLDGLRLAYVGDGNNVARSLAILGSLAGLHVAVASPPGYALEEDLAPPPGATRPDQPAHRPARGRRRRGGRLHRRLGQHGRRGDRRGAPARPRRLPRRRRAARRGRPWRVRDARPAGAPRRGDHRRGPLRHARAHLGPGGEPPPRAEGPARAAGRTRDEHASAARTGRPGHSAATSSSCRIDSLAFGGEGVARLGDGGLRRVRRRRDPRRPRPRGRAQAQAHLRPRPHARGAEPSPERIAPRADHPGVPWQVLPYERQLEIKRAQVRRSAAADRAAGRLRARGDRAGARTVALPQQARVLVRQRRRRRL